MTTGQPADRAGPNRARPASGGQPTRHYAGRLLRVVTHLRGRVAYCDRDPYELLRGHVERHRALAASNHRVILRSKSTAPARTSVSAPAASRPNASRCSLSATRASPRSSSPAAPTSAAARRSPKAPDGAEFSDGRAPTRLDASRGLLVVRVQYRSHHRDADRQQRGHADQGDEHQPGPVQTTQRQHTIDATDARIPRPRHHAGSRGRGTGRPWRP